MLAAVGKLAPRMAHQVNRRDLAIIMYYEHQYPQGTSHKATLDSHHCYHQINPHEVTAMASTLERLIVDY
jgi:hypothetical protein